jgi:beta-galactosidase
LWGWRDELPSWTWPGAEGQELVVRVYGAGDEVSLVLDDREIAKKPVGNELTTEFRVPYRPGRLTARLFKTGKEAARVSLTTGGQLAGLRLSAEQPTVAAEPDALAFVVVEAVDRAGNLIPVDATEMSLQVSGPGQLVAFGNGDPTDVGSVQDARQKLWHGRALAIIRSTGRPGTIIVSAAIPALPEAKVAIKAR